MKKTLILFFLFITIACVCYAKPPEDRIKEKDVIGVKIEPYYKAAKDAGVIEEKLGVAKIKPENWHDVKIEYRIGLRVIDEIGTDTVQEQKIKDGIETDTSIKEKKVDIVNEEVMVNADLFAQASATIRIDVLDLSRWLLVLDTLPIEQQILVIQKILTIKPETLQLIMTSMTPQELQKLQTFVLSPETLKLVLANTSKQDIPKLAVLVYDLSYQARAMNETFLSIKESEKLKATLRLLPSKQYTKITFSFLKITSDDPTIYYINVNKFVDIAEMQREIKGKDIKLAVLGVSSDGSSDFNNTALQEIGAALQDLPLYGKEIEIAYMAFKEIRPDVPVGFPVAYNETTMQAWFTSFKIKPDVWLLYNMPTFGANWRKVKTKWFANKPVIANINHHWQYHDYGNQQYGGAKYNETIKTLQALGYAGNIYWR